MHLSLKEVAISFGCKRDNSLSTLSCTNFLFMIRFWIFSLSYMKKFSNFLSHILKKYSAALLKVKRVRIKPDNPNQQFTSVFFLTQSRTLTVYYFFTLNIHLRFFFQEKITFLLKLFQKFML